MEYTVIKEGSDDFDKNAHIAAVLKRLAEEPYVDKSDPEEDARIMAAVKWPDPAVACANMQRVGPKIKKLPPPPPDDDDDFDD